MQEVMVDPVCIADGSSYDRSSIQQWFVEHNTSPVTGLAVDTRELWPNSTVRAVTALYHHHKGSPSP
jgi:U-box domain